MKLSRSLLSSLLALTVFGCAASTGPDDDDDLADDESALRGGTPTFVPHADGNFEVTCTTAAGVSWSYELAAVYRYHPAVCDGIALHGKPGAFEHQVGNGETIRFHVTRQGTYRFALRAVRAWHGPADHAEAAAPGKLAATFDGACVGAFDIASSDEASPVTPAIVLKLTPGDHAFTVAMANDYWEEASGTDRNIFVAPVRISKVSRAVSAAPPADACALHGIYPRPESPFAAGACTGAPLTSDQARAKFAPGSTFAELGKLRVEARTRHCSDVTGCAEWRAGDAIPYTFTWSDPRQGALTETRWLGLPGAGDPTRVALRAKTAEWQDPFRLQLAYLKGDQGFHVNLGVDGSPVNFDETYYKSWVGPCTELECPSAYRVYGGAFRAGVKQSTITASCLQVVGTTTIRAPRATTFDEYEIGFLSRY